MLIPLIFFNLLISIISNTFDKVYSEKVASDYKEKAHLVLEIEKMFKCNRHKEKMQYLSAIVKRVDGLAEAAGDEWEGRFSVITKDLLMMKFQLGS